jgi:C-terminal processing protease CtpA/Prc
VRVVHVEERSPAERADWRPGDFMVTVVGEPVVDVIAQPVEPA